jgi:tRNA G10  N-methylase Trm11
MIDPILTAKVGHNADLFVDILDLYAPPGSLIADVTCKAGSFWKHVDGAYTTLGSDISKKVFKRPSAIDHHLVADAIYLPYRDESLDVCVVDPPYGNGGTTTRTDAVAKTYALRGMGKGPRGILKLYDRMFLEIQRVLKPKGIVIAKCQDMVNNGEQWWMHISIYEMARDLGFKMEDIFVPVQNKEPMMRHDYQKHARKNHSFFLVFQKRR